MEMDGAHQHAIGHHDHPIGTHEMSSAGIGDVKLDSLLTFWKRDNVALIGNVGVSFPTGSITQQADDGSVLPYPFNAPFAQPYIYAKDSGSENIKLAEKFPGYQYFIADENDIVEVTMNEL